MRRTRHTLNNCQDIVLSDPEQVLRNIPHVGDLRYSRVALARPEEEAVEECRVGEGEAADDREVDASFVAGRVEVAAEDQVTSKEATHSGKRRDLGTGVGKAYSYC